MKFEKKFDNLAPIRKTTRTKEEKGFRQKYIYPSVVGILCNAFTIGRCIIICEEERERKGEGKGGERTR